MEGLHLVTAVTDRHRAEKVIRIFNENNVFTTDVVLGNGTASSEVLDYLYLTPVEKAIVFGIITDSGVSQLFKDFKNKMYIEVPGNGIVVSVPLNSVGGKRRFEYILDGQTAKGTGAEYTEKFFGFSIASEKEIHFIVVPAQGRNNIMKAIMEKAGLDSKAQSIVFSLPVSNAIGLWQPEQ